MNPRSPDGGDRKKPASAQVVDVDQTLDEHKLVSLARRQAEHL
jgi:hypothetical protein